METFTCVMCGKETPIKTTGGAGYATQDEPNEFCPKTGKVCYDCCAVIDKAWMEKTGRATLYVSDGMVSNWPGTLRFAARVVKGKHNIARTRYDVWFQDHTGREWHGVQYGENTQICRCRRLGTGAEDSERGRGAP